MMPAFSRAIAATVVPMVHADRGDGRGCRSDDVGRVEAPAEADLDHCRLDTCAPKHLEGHRRRDLEECRRHGQRAGRLQPIGHTEHVVCCLLECVRVNRRVIDDEALGEVDEVRGDVSGSANALRPQRAVGERRDRPFAVCPGDVQRGEAPLRMPKRRAQRLHVLQTQFDPEGLEREQTF